MASEKTVVRQDVAHVCRGENVRVGTYFSNKCLSTSYSKGTTSNQNNALERNKNECPGAQQQENSVILKSIVLSSLFWGGGGEIGVH